MVDISASAHKIFNIHKVLKLLNLKRCLQETRNECFAMKKVLFTLVFIGGEMKGNSFLF